MEVNKIYQGDCIEVLKTLPDNSINCCVTSPPYFGLRDYGVEGQIGLEKSINEYIEKLVLVFREIRRVLRDDGSLWINLGDSYNHKTTEGAKIQGNPEFNKNRPSREATRLPARELQHRLQNKDLIGIPWRVAFALQADGWILRQDIIWHKPNPMPESIKDRFTKSHEYIFMFVKKQSYYFDADSVREPMSEKTKERDKYKFSGAFKGQFQGSPVEKRWQDGRPIENPSFFNESGRNRRSVWTVSVKPYKGSHFATFPMDLIEPCILSTCPEFVCPVCGKIREKQFDREYVDRPNGDELEEFNHERGIAPGKGQARNRWSGGNIPIQPKHFIGYSDCGCCSDFNNGIVIDPFMGAGTTALVALKNNRNYVGIELNPDYITLAEQRIATEMSKFSKKPSYKESVSRLEKLI